MKSIVPLLHGQNITLLSYNLQHEKNPSKYTQLVQRQWKT
jgi:hypothetical protein